MYKNAMATKNFGSKQADNSVRESGNVSCVDGTDKPVRRKYSCRNRLDSDEDMFMNGVIRK
jgi:hypothetical protein